MAWGNKKRLGAKQGSQSEQFRDDKKKGKKGKKGAGGGVTHDGRCAECGGVEGRHNQIRRSQPIYNDSRQPTGRYKIVHERCSNA